MNQFEEKIRKQYKNNIHFCLVIHRDEMPLSKNKESFKEVGLNSLTSSVTPINTSAFVMFVDKDGSTKMLKNRYGMTGIVISEKQYEHYIELVKKEAEENRQAVLVELQKIEDENNKSNSGTKKKSFLGRLFGK